jgi:hypothetical protein
MMCKDSCSRCGDNFDKQLIDTGVPLIPTGFANLSHITLQKQHQALLEPRMVKVRQKVRGSVISAHHFQ